MKAPMVSIIVATHNRVNLLPKAIQSLLIQTYKDFEIIIIDDASQDETPSVIAALCRSDPRIRSIRSEQNIGPGAARNLGIQQARGEFIAILDDDDIAYPERLEIQVNLLINNPDIGLVFSSVEHFDETMQTLSIQPDIVVRGLFPANPDMVFELLYLENNYIPNTTIMMRKNIWNDFRYPTNPWVGEDWFLCLALSGSGIKMIAIEKPLVRLFRGRNREGLCVTPMVDRFTERYLVLSMVRKLLKDKGIKKFEHLHKLAISNQMVYESRHYVGIRGVFLISKAFFLAPKNAKVHEQIQWYKQKIINRIMKRD